MAQVDRPAGWSTQEVYDAADMHTYLVEQNEDNKDQYYGRGEYAGTGTLDRFNDIWESGNVELAMYAFLVLIVASTEPQNGANMVGMLEGDYAVDAAGASVMAQITKLNSEISDMTTGATDATVEELASCFDDMISILENDEIEACFEPEALSTILTETKRMRSTIYVEGSTSENNPKEGSPGIYFAAKSGEDYYYQSENPDVVEGGQPFAFDSIDQMQQFMSLKGDKGGATEAAKIFTDALSVINSSTQGINAAQNQEINASSSFEKNILAFLSSFCKNIIDLYSSIKQSTSQGEQ